MTIDITQIVLAAFALIGTIVTAVAVPYIKSRTSAQRQREINEWIAIAVTAAEQLFTDPKTGRTKKAYVLRFLKEKGYAVDETALDTMIESAVYQLKSGLIAVDPT